MAEEEWILISPFKNDLSDTDVIQVGQGPIQTIRTVSGPVRAFVAGAFVVVSGALVASVVAWLIDNSIVTTAILVLSFVIAALVGMMEVNRESRSHSKAVDRKAYAEQESVVSNQRMAERTHEARLEVWQESEKVKIDFDRARAEVERAKAEPYRIQAEIMRRWGETIIARIEAMPMDVASAVSLLQHTGVNVSGLLPEPEKPPSIELNQDRPIKMTGRIDTGATWMLDDGRVASVDLMAKIVKYTCGYVGDARARLKEKQVAFGNEDFALANDALVEVGIKQRMGGSNKTSWAVDSMTATQMMSFVKAGQRPPASLAN